MDAATTIRVEALKLAFRTSRVRLAPPPFGLFDLLDREGLEFGDQCA